MDAQLTLDPVAAATANRSMTYLLALLKLCDDPSPRIAQKVTRRLRELGPGVWEMIREEGILLTSSQRSVLETLFSTHDDEALTEAWLWLSTQTHEHRYLEGALLALCDWQTGEGSGTRGRILLDELAVGFGDFQLQESDKEQSEAAALARYLFDFRGLRGSDSDDFYNPLNSNLVHALETGRGLPITLACIFILVGRRVGLDIGGCPFPGHFLARDEQGEQVFDPFNGGRILSEREVGALIKAAPHEMTTSASAREIVGRVLRNLSVAYHQAGETDRSGAMLSMLRLMDGD